MNDYPYAAINYQAVNARSKETAHGGSPSHWLHPESLEVRHLLEQLDDIVFQAIRGDAASLEKAHQMWPEVVEEIGWELVEESREQYLRYATDLIRQFEEDHVRNPERAISAMEVIALLTRE